MALVVLDMSPVLPQLNIGHRLSTDFEVSGNLRLRSVVLANGPDVVWSEVGFVMALA